MQQPQTNTQTKAVRKTGCPACHSASIRPFYSKRNAPSHSVVLLDSRQDALEYPAGDIELFFCNECGFIFNAVFDDTIQDYSKDYEATQSYSPTFNKFAKRTAERLVEKYDLKNKTVIEIGCGQGEFLTLICELGNNTGIGYDPAYRDEPLDSPAAERITFVADYYSEKYANQAGDFIICKMTLEHIDTVHDFVSVVRRAVGENYDTHIFFQIPNGEYVMRDVAFWDVYYEHVSYFSYASLAHVFRLAGFDVIGLDTDYDDQYLMIEAKPSRTPAENPAVNAEDFARIKDLTEKFESQVVTHLEKWAERLNQFATDNKKVVIWGSGSKGVSFLTTLSIDEQIQYCVDINPRKHGMFMPGTGQEIVAPAFLSDYQPDVVIVMNPVYCDEIQADLDRLGVQAEMMTVDD